MKTKWQEKLNNNPIPWLLESNPWTKYKTLMDLMDAPSSSLKVKKTKQELCSNAKIKNLIKETSDWIAKAPTRNNDPKISYFKLRMLTDFGLNIKDTGLQQIATKATKHTENNMFAIKGILPKRPKKGEKFIKPDLDTNEWHASPCNSPMITYALLKLGYKNAEVKKAVETLKDKWTTKQGWFCHFFFVDSMFKKLQIGCPMAGLVALEVFSLIPELKESLYAKNAYEPLKFHREYEKSIYYFGRSKKFWTLKYPFVWYNALYLADVLTRFNFLKKEKLVKELIDWIEKSQDVNGRFKPNSMFMDYKVWDFADKKEPSPWITFLCCRILKRWYA